MATLTLEQLEQRLQGASDGMIDAIMNGIVAAAQVLEGQIRETIFDTFEGRTGNLARSFKAEFVESRGEISARVVSRLVYAGIQDTGGTIYPRIREYLAVPINEGKQLPVGTYARDVSGLTLIKSKAGNLILARISKGNIAPFFVLKPSVTLAGRQYLAKAEAAAKPEIEAILGDQAESHITAEIER